MFRLAAFLALVGLAGATGVIVWSGWAQVIEAIAKTGWGIPVICLFHSVQLIISSLAWRVLVPSRTCPSLGMFVYFMWIRASVNNLMPVARIGGEIAAIRLMVASGMRKNIAIASTVVELTLSISAIFLFVLLGVILFAMRVNDHDTVSQLVWGISLFLPLIGLLLAVQKVGVFGLLSRLFRVLFRDKWAAFVGNATRLDHTVHSIYRRKNRIVTSAILLFISWSAGSIEIWLALTFLGHQLPLMECVMIEALIQGSVSAAFAVPGALGIQEAGFLVFGSMLGLPPSVAAALAVMRRCRDLLFYVPGLIVWQAHEGKRLFRT